MLPMTGRFMRVPADLVSGAPGPGSTRRRPVNAFPKVPGHPGVVLPGPRQPVLRSRPPVVPEAPAAQTLGGGGGEPYDRVRALLRGAQDRPRRPAEPRQRGGDAGRVRPARMHDMERDVRGVDPPGPLPAEHDLGPLDARVRDRAAVTGRG